MAEVIRQPVPIAHIRFQGTSSDIPLAELDLGALSNDEQVRAAIANYLRVPVANLRSYVIERHANGNLTVRPEAVFG